MHKRVLLVATVQSHIGQFHKALMQLLKEKGWEIHVAARDNLDEKNGLQLEYPDKVFNIPFQRSPFDRRNIEAYRQLKKVIDEGHYDVIHCNTPVGGLLGRLAGRKHRRNGTQVFYTAHGFHFYKGAPKQNWLIYYPIEKWMAQYTDKLITITNEDYALAKRKFRCPVYHMHGVGVDEKRYYPVTHQEQERLKEEMGYHGPVLLNVGELLPNKNHKMAISAMKQIVKQFPEAILLIAGNGPEKKELEAQIKTEDLSDNVQMLGYRTNLEAYQHIADLMLACSYREGLPLNIVESMLSKTPVVASINRGHCELIIDGETGYLVKADDVDTMAQRACNILSGHASIMAEKAYQNGKEYSFTSIKQELSDIYGL